jgi:transposase-like protein
MATFESTLPRDDSVPENLIAFQERFRSERACAKFLRRWKYGDTGFVCPHCAGTRSWYLAARRLDECRSCGKQTSLTAGTMFHKSRKPLRLWFLAIYLFVSGKQGISAMDMMRKLGISYPTAWTWLHKLRGAVACRETSLLSGIVEIDETLEGGRDEGHQGGRGTAKKTVIAGAVEVHEGDAGFGRCRLSVVEDASAQSLGAFLGEKVAPGSALLSDGWAGYNAEATTGLDHFPSAIAPSGLKAHEVLPAVHRVFSLLGRVLETTYQGAARAAYLPLYLAEFEFRFNRRHSKSRALLFQRALSTGMRSRCATYWEIIERDNPRRRAAA